ncbi:PAP2 family protein, partial [Poseidonibacter ostreae]
IYALIFALSVGWSMGTYKMLIGDHFLSHTIITMLIAWLLVLIIYKVTTAKDIR